MNKKVQAVIFSTLFTTSSSLVGVSLNGIAHAETNERAIEVQSEIKSQSTRGYELLEEANRIAIERQEAERLEAERLAKEEAERLEQERLKAIEEQNRKSKVGCNLDNVLEPSFITAEELYEVFMFLDKPEMAELSWIIKNAEELSGINAMIISGIVANESAWGTSSRAVNSGNYTGYGVYSDDSVGINHGSAYENIVNTFLDVKENYLTEGAMYHYGYSTYHINIKYSADDNWKLLVNDIAKTIESVYHQYVRN